MHFMLHTYYFVLTVAFLKPCKLLIRHALKENFSGSSTEGRKVQSEEAEECIDGINAASARRSAQEVGFCLIEFHGRQFRGEEALPPLIQPDTKKIVSPEAARMYTRPSKVV